jgi:hypothetical protein
MTEPTVFDAAKHTATEATVNADWSAGYEQAMAIARGSALELVAKAKALVELLDDAEVNHGGLVGGVTLRAKNELRLELSRWR